MNITITTKQLLNLLLILAWIIFAGLCIEAGSFITNAAFALINPDVVPRLWKQIDLSNLFNYNHGYFFTITLIIGIVSILKAWLFFIIIKLLHNKNVSITKPFSKEVRSFIVYLSCVSLMIGLFSTYGIGYTESLTKQGIQMPDTKDLRLGGADVWLFMSVILFIIAQVFKRGIEIQTENELTV